MAAQQTFAAVGGRCDHEPPRLKRVAIFVTVWWDVIRGAARRYFSRLVDTRCGAESVAYVRWLEGADGGGLL
jgi:hypothetical protein